MQAFISPYLLRKKSPLNSREQSSVQEGALIKVRDQEDWGVGDICPKPELGDQALAAEIKSKGILFMRAFELALEDLEARKAGRSLLANKFVINNFLITDYHTADLNADFYRNRTVKIKADRDIKSLSHLLNQLGANIKIRLDFNSVLSVDEFENFLRLLSTGAKNKIEYIEDPTPVCSDWRRWNQSVPLAFDFQAGDYHPEIAKYLIIKPSRQRLAAGLKYFTLTSAMDHPVGLAHGLRIAQTTAQNESGFLTLDLLDVPHFTKYFVQIEDRLNFSALALQDTGIGMSEELQKLEWVKL